MTKGEILKEVKKELARARKLHPVWPDGFLLGFAIVQEEIGETQKEVLQFCQMEPTFPALHKKRKMVEKEAIQSLTTLFRFLEGK